MRLRRRSRSRATFCYALYRFLLRLCAYSSYNPNFSFVVDPARVTFSLSAVADTWGPSIEYMVVSVISVWVACTSRPLATPSNQMLPFSLFLGNYCTLIIRFLLLFLRGGIRSKDVVNLDPFSIVSPQLQHTPLRWQKLLSIWVHFLGTSS